MLTGGQVPGDAVRESGADLGRDSVGAGRGPAAHQRATNISTVTIDARRARVSCNAELVIDSDGPLDVSIENCGYARPQAATPLFVPLTVAYEPCTESRTATHAAPLSFGSCSSPQPSSAHLTMGTLDSNARPANAVGSLRYRVAGGDVQVEFSMTDVRRR